MLLQNVLVSEGILGTLFFKIHAVYNSELLKRCRMLNVLQNFGTKMGFCKKVGTSFEKI